MPTLKPGLQRRTDPTSVRHLLNLGPDAAKRLAAVGIHSQHELRQVGAVEAFKRLLEREPGLHPNLLYRLHGALAGVHEYEHRAGRAVAAVPTVWNRHAGSNGVM